jgi:hypothetical protein
VAELQLDTVAMCQQVSTLLAGQRGDQQIP